MMWLAPEQVALAPATIIQEGTNPPITKTRQVVAPVRLNEAVP